MFRHLNNQNYYKMEHAKVESFNLIGIEVRTSNQNGKAAKDIPGLWQEFMSKGVFQNIPDKLNSKVYCVYMEYEGDHNMPYTAFIGCEVGNATPAPEGMSKKSIPGGNFNQYPVQGKLSEVIIGEWMKIWQTDLDRNYKADFEVYEDISQDPENGKLNIFVGVN